jgi:hypothetical protein
MHYVNSALCNLQLKDTELPEHDRNVRRTCLLLGLFLDNSFYVPIFILIFSFYYRKDERKGKFVAEQSYGCSASLDHMLNNEKEVVGLNCDTHTSRGIFHLANHFFFRPTVFFCYSRLISLSFLHVLFQFTQIMTYHTRRKKRKNIST